MQLSCLPVSFFPELADGRMQLREWFEAARTLNLDAADIGMVLLRNHTPTYLAGIRAELEQIGIGIGMITACPDFTVADALQRERELDYARRDVALASQLGARFLRVTAGQMHPGETVAAMRDRAVSALRRLAGDAERYGIVLVIENHFRPFGWEQRDLTFEPENFLAVVRALEDTPLRVQFDTANAAAVGADVIGLAAEVRTQIETVHVADTRAFGEFAPVLVGTGAVPFRDFFGYLVETGYDGWLCIEEASRTGMDGVAKAVQYVRRTWADCSGN